MKSLILIACLLQTAFAAPQLLTFKDGKVGVNFFGYHAEAGLGGGNQNGPNGGLLGGLHASAGTPWGQNAAAGLGGNVNGRAVGGLYAGAQATPDVGASAVLGGDTSQGGFSGSEAYANGKVASRTRTLTGTRNIQHNDASAELPPAPVTQNINAIQKIRPPKKYYPSERSDYLNIDNNNNNYNDNNGIALHTNKTKNIYDIEQQKPASVFIAKPINKTTISTPFPNTAKGVAQEQISIETVVSQVPVAHVTKQPAFIKHLLNNNEDNIDNFHHHPHQHHNDNQLSNNNEFIQITTSSSSSLSNAIAPTTSSSSLQPTIISSVSLSHLNEKDNSIGGITAASADSGITADDDGVGGSGKGTIIITRNRKTLRNRYEKPRNNHPHPRHHPRLHQIHRQQHPKRIHLNQRQRQRSKTIVQVLEQEPQQLEAKSQQQPEELLFKDPPQQKPLQSNPQQQQYPVRRQLIAPAPAHQGPPPPPAHPCDSDCTQANRHVRSDVVQNALQIPIGILQSLQNSFGNFGVAPAKGH